jgi:hypothetical protein
MAQATKALSIPDDDRNDDDPGQAHFDATLMACGEAVAHLINSSPRTPTVEQICDLIRDTLRNGFESDQAVALDDIAGRSDDPADPLNFKAAPEIKFKETNAQFAEANLPGVRLAFKFLEKDRAGAVDALRKMIAEGNGHLIDVMQEGWETVAGKFESIASLMQTAQARLEIARRHIEEEVRP